ILRFFITEFVYIHPWTIKVRKNTKTREIYLNYVSNLMGEPHYPSLEDEIYKPSFKFSKIFEYNNLFEIYVLRTEYYIDSAKTYALERLYAKLKDDRNPYMHSTAPIAKTCDNIEEASSIVDEVITLIADSYTRLSDVII
ncbi:MAG: hypothetical protein QM345_03720, partial [Bacillota bacterium]|nr:hypothetical protein [Bacillota bacterium]